MYPSDASPYVVPGNPLSGLAGPAPNANFLNLFGDSRLTLQEIAEKAQHLQRKIDENAEQEKAALRAAAEQKHQEIEKHAAELTKHAGSSIDAYKTSQLQAAERQKAYQQAVVRQQAEQAKRLIDQQASQAINAVEARDRQMDFQKQQASHNLGTQHFPHPVAPASSIRDPSPCVEPVGAHVGKSHGDSQLQAQLPPESLDTRQHAMFRNFGPVSAADAGRAGSLGAAAARADAYLASTLPARPA